MKKINQSHRMSRLCTKKYLAVTLMLGGFLSSLTGPLLACTPIMPCIADFECIPYGLDQCCGGICIEECESPEFCDEIAGECVECLDDENCTATCEYCDTSNNTCVESHVTSVTGPTGAYCKGDVEAVTAITDYELTNGCTIVWGGDASVGTTTSTDTSHEAEATLDTNGVSFEINAKTSTQSSAVDQSGSFSVCEVASITGEGVTSDATGTPSVAQTIYVAKGAPSSTITLTANKTPSSASWPAGKPTWVNATATATDGEATFPIDTVSASSDGTIVTASCGTCGTCTKKIRVVVFDITEIRFKHPTVWKTIDEDYKFLGVFTDDTVTFGVVTEPPGITLPDGSLTWGGDASGDGEEVSVTFTPHGSHTVTVSLSSGGGNTLTGNIMVQDEPTGVGENTFCLAFPAKTLTAVTKDLAGDARSWAVTAYPPGGTPPIPARNCRADAARHALWTCLLTRYCGSTYSLGLSQAHEVSNPGPHTEGTMDMHNNNEGAWIGWHHTHNAGGDQTCCEEAVEDAIEDGTLWYLDQDHGTGNTAEDALLQPTNE